MLAPFTNSLLGIAEIGGNRLLSLDDRVLDRCAELAGHCVEIHLSDLDLRLYCHPGSWGIRLSLEAPAKKVDASISGRSVALLNLALQDDKISTSIQEGVNINGNAAVARQLQTIFAELDPDWEEALSEYCGDLLAYQLGRQARIAGGWLRQSAESLAQTSSEYLREESRLTPGQVEFDRFRQSAERLRQDVERAEVRLRHLSQALSGSQKD